MKLPKFGLKLYIINFIIKRVAHANATLFHLIIRKFVLMLFSSVHGHSLLNG